MDLVQAIVLGIVQGLTEPLPISSSGHLIVVPWLLGWPDQGLVFDVALHFGTLLALVAYFWRTWLGLLLRNRRLLAFILAGSIPGGVIGLAFNNYIEAHFRNPVQIAATLVVFGLVLYGVDRFGSRHRDNDDFGLRDALLIGTAQALALVPGVSRSGVTITTGLALGFKRETAATFSFLLATPITAGATLWAARRLLTEGVPPDQRAAFVVGILSSGIVGFLAIHYLLRYVRTRSYTPFVAYRLAAGALILVLALARG